MTLKRQRNSRRSTYRPRSEAQKQRRRDLWEARVHDRELTARVTEEAALTVRLEQLEVALRDGGAGGIHSRRHTTPLDQIEDDEHRFHVLKARVERLEALWSVNQRKRETRGKIIIGGAILAEAAEDITLGDQALLERLVEIIDRRVERVRDRLTVRDLLGNAPLPLRHGGNLHEGVADALAATGEALPDFDAMTESALAGEPGDDRFSEDAAADEEADGAVRQRLAG